MNDDTERCPFEIGESVVYRPSLRGFGLDAMTPPDRKLVRGRTYKIVGIQNDRYVVVAGYSHPGGGLYWTEFEKGP